jgi:hypothetical protein
MAANKFVMIGDIVLEIHTYIHIYIHTYVCVWEREREGERERSKNNKCIRNRNVKELNTRGDVDIKWWTNCACIMLNVHDRLHLPWKVCRDCDSHAPIDFHRYLPIMALSTWNELRIIFFTWCLEIILDGDYVQQFWT